MKFSVLALHYDGTMAQEGKAHPAVLEALAAARERGVIVVLVTGRILSDLRRGKRPRIARSVRDRCGRGLGQ